MTDDNSTAPPSKSLHIGLWVVQVLLAAMFLMGGAMKMSAPIEDLQAQMSWVTGPMGGLVRFIGLVEVLGGLGLVLPAGTRIAPKLTPVAALGLVVVMILAAITHITLGEYPMIIANLVIGSMAAFVAWGRSKKAPVQARS